jgi:hypothetical protein
MDIDIYDSQYCTFASPIAPAILAPASYRIGHPMLWHCTFVGLPHCLRPDFDARHEALGYA